MNLLSQQNYADFQEANPDGVSNTKEKLLVRTNLFSAFLKHPASTYQMPRDLEANDPFRYLFLKAAT